jgi:hypothetical protein
MEVAATPGANSKPYEKRHKKAPFGPYATADGRLTDEGQRVLEEWLEEYRFRPANLLHKVHRGHYCAGLATFGEDELNSACLLAITKAMLSYDPEKCAKFSTYASNALRYGVELAFRGLDAAEKYGHRLVDGHRDIGSDGTIFDMIPDPDAADPADGESAAWPLSLGAEVQAILKRRVPSWKHREIFSLRFGLHGESPLTLAEVGELFGISKERVRQLTGRVVEQITPDLRKLWRERPGIDASANRAEGI